MSVLVNFKICDNAKECGGIVVCPTGALSYNNEKNTIVIDNKKCISCGLCEKECPIGAIQVAKTQEEYIKLENEINEDVRTIKDLFVDRYGSIPLSEFFVLDSENIKNKIVNDNITLIELYNDDSIKCLLKSIPIKDLTKDMPQDTLFYKVDASDEICKEYNIKELPSLLIFKSNKMLGSIEGYYESNRKKELLEEIVQIMKE